MVSFHPEPPWRSWAAGPAAPWLQCWWLTLEEFQGDCANPGVFYVCSFLPSVSDLVHGLQLLRVTGREGNLIAIFHEEHSRVLQQLQVFTFFPESLPTTKRPFERKTMDRQSTRKPLLGMGSATSDAHMAWWLSCELLSKTTSVQITVLTVTHSVSLSLSFLMSKAPIIVLAAS